MNTLLVAYLRHVIGRIGSGAFGVDAAHLALVVVDELDGVRLQVVEARRFREGGHVVVHVLLCSSQQIQTGLAKEPSITFYGHAGQAERARGNHSTCVLHATTFSPYV